MVKKYFFIFLLSIIGCNVFSQYDSSVIKIRTEQLLKKAALDETTYTLVAIDKYGNPYEQAIAMFDFQLTPITTTINSVSNKLTQEMISVFQYCSKKTKVWFINIKAIENDGRIISLPDLEYIIFPKCKNCGLKNPRKKKRIN